MYSLFSLKSRKKFVLVLWRSFTFFFASWNLEQNISIFFYQNYKYKLFFFYLFKITMKMIALIIIHVTFELSIIMSSLFHRFLLW